MLTLALTEPAALARLGCGQLSDEANAGQYFPPFEPPIFTQREFRKIVAGLPQLILKCARKPNCEFLPKKALSDGADCLDEAAFQERQQ